MEPILSLLLVVLVCVISAVWLFCKCAKLTDAQARKVELIGYVLLLTVLIWELVIKNILSEGFYNADWLFINEKIDTLFLMLESVINQTSFDTSKAWQDFQQMKVDEYLEMQLVTMDVIEAVLQIASAACIAVGRYQDVRNSYKNKGKKRK